MNQESAFARREHLYSQAEEIEVEIDCRIEALKEYVAEEEAEIKSLHYQGMKFIIEARDLEEEYSIVD